MPESPGWPFAFAKGCGMPIPPRLVVWSVLHSPPPPHSGIIAIRPPLQDKTTSRFLNKFFGGALLAQ